MKSNEKEHQPGDIRDVLTLPLWLAGLGLSFLGDEEGHGLSEAVQSTWRRLCLSWWQLLYNGYYPFRG